MALAPFFDKNAVAAAQLLRGYDKEGFARALTQKAPEVVFDSSVAKNPMGRLLTELLVNLLARLYPAITLRATDDAARAYRPELVQLAASINPSVEFADPSAHSLQLVVGETRGRADVPEQALFIG